MPAKSKTMDLSVLQSDVDAISALVRSIGANHKKIADLTDALETDKKTLASYSESVFWKDMGTEVSPEGDLILNQEVPLVYGNHEFDAGKMLRITAGFKVGKRELGCIDGVDAETAIPKLFGDATDKVFDCVDEAVVVSTPEQLSDNFYRRPELFDLVLRDNIKPEVMTEMKRAFPKAFDIVVRDKETYKRVYPDQVESKVNVTTKSGFLEAVGKLPAPILKRAKACIIGLLKENITIAVNVGNTSKASSR